MRDIVITVSLIVNTKVHYTFMSTVTVGISTLSIRAAFKILRSLIKLGTEISVHWENLFLPYSFSLDVSSN